MTTCLETVDLSKHFHKSGGFLTQRSTTVKAVDRVSLSIEQGQTLGLVGETGSGKTTFARLVLRVTAPTQGKIFLNGKETTALTQKELFDVRKEMQMVFQDPYSSLNPRMSVGETLGEPLRIHREMKGRAVKERVNELLEMVGLLPEHAFRYPHQFSGGQRQRITIARAIATSPSLLVLDEPTSALDVSVQAQILMLLKEIQEKFGMTYLFISHNLSVIRYMSDRIAVMYSGRVVELTDVESLFAGALHPYTQALLAAIPDHTRKREKPVLAAIPEETPGLVREEGGCAYRFMCPFAMEVCAKEEPQLLEHEDKHWAACHLYKNGR